MQHKTHRAPPRVRSRRVPRPFAHDAESFFSSRVRAGGMRSRLQRGRFVPASTSPPAVERHGSRSQAPSRWMSITSHRLSDPYRVGAVGAQSRGTGSMAAFLGAGPGEPRRGGYQSKYLMSLLSNAKYFALTGTRLDGLPCRLRFTGTASACELFKDLVDGVLAITERKRWRPHPHKVGASPHAFDRRSTPPPCGTSCSKAPGIPRKRRIPGLLDEPCEWFFSASRVTGARNV